MDAKVDLLEVIRTRRSIGKMRPDTVPREVLEKLIDAAVQAPNHRLTRPWRFWVLTGGAREELGEAMAEAARSGLDTSAGDDVNAVLDRERAKPLRAPAIVVVGIDQEPSDPVLSMENVEAGSAAIQNLLLAAHAMGLAAIWRTGASVYSTTVKRHFGLGDEDVLLGFVYVGYPAVIPPVVERTAIGKVEWWDGRRSSSTGEFDAAADLGG
jgi:nitroreductase